MTKTRNIKLFCILLIVGWVIHSSLAFAQEQEGESEQVEYQPVHTRSAARGAPVLEEPPVPIDEIAATYPIFDDTVLLDGYTKKYTAEDMNTLLAMLKDDTLNSYKMAAAVRVFKDKYSLEVFSRDKKIIEKLFLRRLNRTDSPFVEAEIMHALCRMDRYKYFKSMVPALIQKLDHYNDAVNKITYGNINNIIKTGHNRSREARIIFNTLRKSLFLARRHLSKITVPDDRLKQKLKLVRWAIKVLGNNELKHLPKEVIPLL